MYNFYFLIDGQELRYKKQSAEVKYKLIEKQKTNLAGGVNWAILSENDEPKTEMIFQIKIEDLTESQSLFLQSQNGNVITLVTETAEGGEELLGQILVKTQFYQAYTHKDCAEIMLTVQNKQTYYKRSFWLVGSSIGKTKIEPLEIHSKWITGSSVGEFNGLPLFSISSSLTGNGVSILRENEIIDFGYSISTSDISMYEVNIAWYKSDGFGGWSPLPFSSSRTTLSITGSFNSGSFVPYEGQIATGVRCELKYKNDILYQESFSVIQSLQVSYSPSDRRLSIGSNLRINTNRNIESDLSTSSNFILARDSGGFTVECEDTPGTYPLSFSFWDESETYNQQQYEYNTTYEVY